MLLLIYSSEGSVITRELFVLSELVVLNVIVSCTGKETAALAERLHVGEKTPAVTKFDIEKVD